MPQRRSVLVLLLSLTWSLVPVAAEEEPEKLTAAALIVPAEGACDVPVDVGRIVILFDADLSSGPFAIARPEDCEMVPLAGPIERIGSRIVRIPLARLEPGRTYGFDMNWGRDDVEDSKGDRVSGLHYSFHTAPPGGPPRPRVLRTMPPPGAVGVDPATDRIEVFFDRDMDPLGISLFRCGDLPAPRFPEGEPARFLGPRRLVIPVELDPGTRYGLKLNDGDRGSVRSRWSARRAKPFALEFETGEGPAAAGTVSPAEAARQRALLYGEGTAKVMVPTEHRGVWRGSGVVGDVFLSLAVDGRMTLCIVADDDATRTSGRAPFGGDPGSTDRWFKADVREFDLLGRGRPVGRDVLELAVGGHWFVLGREGEPPAPVAADPALAATLPGKWAWRDQGTRWEFLPDGRCLGHGKEEDRKASWEVRGSAVRIVFEEPPPTANLTPSMEEAGVLALKVGGVKMADLKRDAEARVPDRPPFRGYAGELASSSMPGVWTGMLPEGRVRLALPPGAPGRLESPGETVSGEWGVSEGKIRLRSPGGAERAFRFHGHRGVILDLDLGATSVFLRRDWRAATRPELKKDLEASGREDWDRVAVPGFTYVGTWVPEHVRKPLPVIVVRHERTGLEFCLLRGGTVRPGDPEDGEGRPEITVAPFLMSRTEVTGAAWRTLGGEPPPGPRGAEVPVTGVTFEEAAAWCAEAGLRLPSEAEWEYAHRAGTTERYFDSDQPVSMSTYGWFSLYSNQRIMDVGRLWPNAFGLLDTAGNAEEWCPGKGGGVLRGGSSADPAEAAVSHLRREVPPGERRPLAGFRPAADLNLGR